MENGYILVMDWLYKISMWIAGISLLVMVTVIPIGIFGRYVLNSGYSWPEPVSIICMIIFTFVGAAVSYRAGSHIAVSMLTDRLSGEMKKICNIIAELLMMLICLFILRYGSTLCIEMWDQPIAEFPIITEGIKYLPLPIGSAITLLFVIERLFLGSQAERPIVQRGNAG